MPCPATSPSRLTNPLPGTVQDLVAKAFAAAVIAGEPASEEAKVEEQAATAAEPEPAAVEPLVVVTGAEPGLEQPCEADAEAETEAEVSNGMLGAGGAEVVQRCTS